MSSTILWTLKHLLKYAIKIIYLSTAKNTFHSLKIDPTRPQGDFGFKLSFGVGFMISVVTAMFVIFYVRERVSRAKLLQFVSGANKIVFWLTSFVIDYVVYILVVTVFLAVLVTYQKEGYSEFDDMKRMFYLLSVFGFSILPLTYLLSFLFKVPSNGFVLLTIVNIVTGAFLFLAYFTLNNKRLGLDDLAQTLGKVFLIFPHYSLTRGLDNLKRLSMQLNFCDKRCHFIEGCKDFGKFCASSNVSVALTSLRNDCCDKSYYSYDETGIGRSLHSLTLVGVLSFLVLFAVEYRWIQNIFFKLRRNDS